MKRTKIVATLGPASSSAEVIEGMIKAGADVCRINFSHGSYENVLNQINIIRDINKRLGSHTAILADLQGPKLRIGVVKDNGVELVAGKEIIITTKECEGTAERVYITYPQFPKDVKVGENYALVVSTNAGLWGYSIGDTVRFVSTEPYRLVVTGRTKHFISAFGEHVIGEEVEYSLMKAAEEEGLHITEFTVAPMIQQGSGRSYHEWFVEFEHKPSDLRRFAIKVDDNLRNKNIYYNDLITGNILQPLQIRAVKKKGFIDYMKSVGKLGGQNKVPRLSNDRKLAGELAKYIE